MPLVPVSERARYGVALALIFASGLAVHLTVFHGRHREGDELIYQTLVQQLEAGHGYTLRGSWLVERHLLDAQYDRPLFHLPPGGVFMFWMFHAIFGQLGFPLAQLASYAVFYFGLVMLVEALDVEPRQLAGLLTAALAAASPIMSHVTTHYWLDGPLLAGATAASALLVWAARRDQLVLALGAGLALGASSWVKPTAFLVLPGALALAWGVRGPMSLRRFCAVAATTSLVALALHLPWLAWRWSVLGSPLDALSGHAEAGHPAQTLIASSPYVQFVTVTRPAWCYLTLLPRVHWTLLPSLALFLFAWRDRETRGLGVGLSSWIAIVVGLHVALGFVGYSKVLRYVILATPALALLASVLISSLWTRLRTLGPSSSQRRVAHALLALAMLGVGLEIAQGVSVSLAPNAALIVPWIGGLAF